ncbi:MAG: hypothetical protein JW959_01580 [Pirellulales bacterium]|nr:hypothetical protein [Pirellulales bacterium]
MAYPSVDYLQKLLAKEVFHYAKDAKKAAGRSLGTLVEIITFYCLKSWGFEYHIAIERKLPEFANEDITHNVEYSLHPAKPLATVSFDLSALPLTASKISRGSDLASFTIADQKLRSNTLLTKDMILRNACNICELEDRFVNVYLKRYAGMGGQYVVMSLHKRPFAIVECKRVGIEEGMRKGPQTIEKAKQGAYVARSVSSLQKVRFADGRRGGLIEKRDGTFQCDEYVSLLDEIVDSNDPELLSQFVLTIGVVSNHGNWFTSHNHNKELKVLSQSYDWLLFLTDAGIAQFIDEALLHPDNDLASVREAFLASYTGKKSANRFTKVKIALAADNALQSYFRSRAKTIAKWFNVISPSAKMLPELHDELGRLTSKNWEAIHQ